MNKICYKCEQEKETKLFNNNKGRPDGKSDYCQVCESIMNRINRERRRQKDPVGYLEYNKRQYNKFRQKPGYKERRAKNRKQHKLKELARGINFDSKNRNLTDRITAHDLWCLAKRQKMLCAISGLRLTNDNMSIDHIIPVSKNGSNHISNLQLVLFDVNQMKRAYLTDYFFNLIKTIYLHNFKSI